MLLGPDVKLPASLQKYPKVLKTSDEDCFEKLTKLLMTPGKFSVRIAQVIPAGTPNSAKLLNTCFSLMLTCIRLTNAKFVY